MVFYTLIGINIGAVIGGIMCKKFNGQFKDLMKWMNQ